MYARQNRTDDGHCGGAHRSSGQNRHLDVKDDDSRCEGRRELDRVGLWAQHAPRIKMDGVDRGQI